MDLFDCSKARLLQNLGVAGWLWHGRVEERRDGLCMLRRNLGMHKCTVFKCILCIYDIKYIVILMYS